MFGNDKQIENFMQSKDEYEEDSIDLDCELEDQIVVHSNVGKKLDDSYVNTHVDKVVKKLELIRIDPEKRRV